jgi:hypothetical protein
MNTRIRWLRSEWPTSTTMLELPICLVVRRGPRGACGSPAVLSRGRYPREAQRSIRRQAVDGEVVRHIIDNRVVEPAVTIAFRIESECTALAGIDVVLPHEVT